jgi:hypothetical protein
MERRESMIHTESIEFEFEFEFEREREFESSEFEKMGRVPASSGAFESWRDRVRKRG